MASFISNFRVGVVLSVVVLGTFLGLIVGSTLWDPARNTELDGLWIDPASEVAANNAYNDLYSDPKSQTEVEPLFMTAIDRTSSVATPELLSCWLEISKAAAGIVVEVNGKKYTTNDVCRPGLLQYGGPCLDFNILDCFQEGDYDYPYKAAAAFARTQLTYAQEWGLLLLKDAETGSTVFTDALLTYCVDDDFPMIGCVEKYHAGSLIPFLDAQEAELNAAGVGIVLHAAIMSNLASPTPEPITCANWVTLYSFTDTATGGGLSLMADQTTFLVSCSRINSGGLKTCIDGVDVNAATEGTASPTPSVNFGDLCQTTNGEGPACELCGFVYGMIRVANNITPNSYLGAGQIALSFPVHDTAGTWAAGPATTQDVFTAAYTAACNQVELAASLDLIPETLPFSPELCGDLIADGSQVIGLIALQEAECTSNPGSALCLQYTELVTTQGLALAELLGDYNTTWLDQFWDPSVREPALLDAILASTITDLYPITKPFSTLPSFVGMTSSQILTAMSNECGPADFQKNVQFGGTSKGLLPITSKTLVLGGTVPATTELGGATCSCDAGWAGEDCTIPEDKVCACTSIEDPDCADGLLEACGAYFPCIASYSALKALFQLVPSAPQDMIYVVEYGGVVGFLNALGPIGDEGDDLAETLIGAYCQYSGLACGLRDEDQYVTMKAVAGGNANMLGLVHAAAQSMLGAWQLGGVPTPTALGYYQDLVHLRTDNLDSGAQTFVTTMFSDIDSCPKIDAACSGCNLAAPGAACLTTTDMSACPSTSLAYQTATSQTFSAHMFPCADYLAVAVVAETAFNDDAILYAWADSVFWQNDTITTVGDVDLPGFGAGVKGSDLFCDYAYSTLDLATLTTNSFVTEDRPTGDDCAEAFIAVGEQAIWEATVLPTYPAQTHLWSYEQNYTAASFTPRIGDAAGKKGLVTQAKISAGVASSTATNYPFFVAAIDALLGGQCAAVTTECEVGQPTQYCYYVPATKMEIEDCLVLTDNIVGAFSQSASNILAIASALGKYVISANFNGACAKGGVDCREDSECGNGVCSGTNNDLTQVTSYAGIYSSLAPSKIVDNLASPTLATMRYLANAPLLIAANPSDSAAILAAGPVIETIDEATAQLILDAWRAELAEIRTRASDSCAAISEASSIPSDSIDRLLDEFSVGSAKLIIAGYSVMLFYCSFTLINWSSDKTVLFNTSDALVGALGVMLVSIAVGAGLGLSLLIGIEFNATTTQVLPFIMLGLGVDDMFVLARTFPRFRESLSPADATAECMKIAGPSVTLTSFVNVGVFAIGRLAPQPVVADMAAQSALIIGCSYVLMMAVFPFILTLNYSRKGRGMMDCLPCVKVGTVETKEEEADLNCFNRSLAGKYADFLAMPIVKVIVLLGVFGGLLGAGLGGYVGNLQLGLSLSTLTPETASTYNGLEVFANQFGFYNFRIVFKEADMSTRANQIGVATTFDDVIATSKVLTVSNSAWVLAFALWGSVDTLAYPLDQDGRVCDPNNALTGGNCGRDYNCTIVTDATANPYPYYPAADFYKCLEIWVNVDRTASAVGPGFLFDTSPETLSQYGSYKKLLYSDAAKTRIPISTGNPLFAVGLNDTPDFVTLIEETAAVTGDDKSPPSYVTGTPFSYWEQYPDLQETVVRAIGYGLLVAFGAASFLLIFISEGDKGFGAKLVSGIWGACIITGVIGAMVFTIWGFATFLDIRLSALPAISLIMSVGVGVEFTAHIALAFINATGTKNERMKEALHIMFAPLIDGAVTTFVGVLMLAFSELPFIVLYYFGLYVIIVVTGLIYGGLILPVLLSVVGPPSTNTGDGASMRKDITPKA